MPQTNIVLGLCMLACLAQSVTTNDVPGVTTTRSKDCAMVLSPTVAQTNVVDKKTTGDPEFLRVLVTSGLNNCKRDCCLTDDCDAILFDNRPYVRGVNCALLSCKPHTKCVAIGVENGQTALVKQQVVDRLNNPKSQEAEQDKTAKLSPTMKSILSKLKTMFSKSLYFNSEEGDLFLDARQHGTPHRERKLLKRSTRRRSSRHNEEEDDDNDDTRHHHHHHREKHGRARHQHKDKANKESGDLTKVDYVGEEVMKQFYVNGTIAIEYNNGTVHHTKEVMPIGTSPNSTTNATLESFSSDGVIQGDEPYTYVIKNLTVSNATYFYALANGTLNNTAYSVLWANATMGDREYTYLNVSAATDNDTYHFEAGNASKDNASVNFILTNMVKQNNTDEPYQTVQVANNSGVYDVDVDLNDMSNQTHELNKAMSNEEEGANSTTADGDELIQGNGTGQANMTSGVNKEINMAEESNENVDSSSVSIEPSETVIAETEQITPTPALFLSSSNFDSVQSSSIVASEASDVSATLTLTAMTSTPTITPTASALVYSTETINPSAVMIQPSASTRGSTVAGGDDDANDDDDEEDNDDGEEEREKGENADGDEYNDKLDSEDNGSDDLIDEENKNKNGEIENDGANLDEDGAQREDVLVDGEGSNTDNTVTNEGEGDGDIMTNDDPNNPSSFDATEDNTGSIGGETNEDSGLPSGNDDSSVTDVNEQVQSPDSSASDAQLAQVTQFDQSPDNFKNAEKRIDELKEHPGTAAMLISGLTVGVVMVLVVIGVLGRKIYESYQKRHYSRMDFLVNGIYS